MAHLIRAYRGGDAMQRPGWWFAWVADIHADDFRETLAAVKRIPIEDREWNEERKEWWFALEREDDLEALFPAFAAYRLQGQLL